MRPYCIHAVIHYPETLASFATTLMPHFCAVHMTCALEIVHSSETPRHAWLFMQELTEMIQPWKSNTSRNTASTRIPRP